MSRRCEICGKGVQSGFNKPHSKHRTKRKFFPNLQKRTLSFDGIKKKIKICTRCLKSI
ncbi:MAG TPA: 50S ribosomal protein L28 [Candidatus Wirthbacteria bacterium]|nr:50S ribosomal protein L28 [Candidatus Wirthbacteria bacterium]